MEPGKENIEPSELREKDQLTSPFVGGDPRSSKDQSTPKPCRCKDGGIPLKEQNNKPFVHSTVEDPSHRFSDADMRTHVCPPYVHNGWRRFDPVLLGRWAFYPSHFDHVCYEPRGVLLDDFPAHNASFQAATGQLNNGSCLPDDQLRHPILPPTLAYAPNVTQTARDCDDGKSTVRQQPFQPFYNPYVVTNPSPSSSFVLAASSSSSHLGESHNTSSSSSSFSAIAPHPNNTIGQATNVQTNQHSGLNSLALTGTAKKLGELRVIDNTSSSSLAGPSRDRISENGQEIKQEPRGLSVQDKKSVLPSLVSLNTEQPPQQYTAAYKFPRRPYPFISLENEAGTPSASAGASIYGGPPSCHHRSVAYEYTKGSLTNQISSGSSTAEVSSTDASAIMEDLTKQDFSSSTDLLITGVRQRYSDIYSSPCRGGSSSPVLYEASDIMGSSPAVREPTARLKHNSNPQDSSSTVRSLSDISSNIGRSNIGGRATKLVSSRKRVSKNTGHNQDPLAEKTGAQKSENVNVEDISKPGSRSVVMQKRKTKVAKDVFEGRHRRKVINAKGSSPAAGIDNKVRSTRGCWICRLRKKKCDEGRPLCFMCSRLGIQCDYSKQRPVYLNDEQEALKMRTVIASQIREKKEK